MGSPAGSVDPIRSSASSGKAADGADQSPAPLRCLMCGGAEHGVVFVEQGIDILRCKSCGHVFSSFRADPHFAGYWGNEVAAGEHHYWSKARARMHRDFFKRFHRGTIRAAARHGERARVLSQSHGAVPGLGCAWLRNLAGRRETRARATGPPEGDLQPAAGCRLAASVVRHHHDCGTCSIIFRVPIPCSAAATRC